MFLQITGIQLAWTASMFEKIDAISLQVYYSSLHLPCKWRNEAMRIQKVTRYGFFAVFFRSQMFERMFFEEWFGQKSIFPSRRTFLEWSSKKNYARCFVIVSICVCPISLAGLNLINVVQQSLFPTKWQVFL